MNEYAARSLHAQLHLVDRQLIDLRTGRLCGKVDDLELDLSRDPPTVTALLCGPQAWGHRLPGALGRLVVSVHRRLSGKDEPDRIPAHLVTDVDSAVKISVEPGLDLQGLDRWIEEHFIDRIPGAGDAPE
jgi:hypothetical protein